MNQPSLESFITSLSLLLIGSLTFTSILTSADILFKWDVLPPFGDRIAMFVLVTQVLLVLAGSFTSLLLNVRKRIQSLGR